jgi:hypothetical protein
MTTVQSGTLVLGDKLASSKDLTLYGGATFQTNNYAHSLDNGSLTVRGENATYAGNLSAKSATLNFIAPVTVSQTLLTVTGTADISNSSVNVGLTGGTSLPMGTQLSLVEATGTLTASNLTEGTGIAEAGVTAIYGLSLTLDPSTGGLTGTVTSGGAAEQSKALSEGFLSGIGLVTQGADHIAGKGMESAVGAARSAARSGVSTGYGLAGFGSLSGGSLRYNSGSHLDMRNLSLLAGLAWGSDVTPGRLTLGAFFEYGNGSYDTPTPSAPPLPWTARATFTISAAAFWPAWTSPAPGRAVPTPKLRDARAASTMSTTAPICATPRAARRNTIPPRPGTASISAAATS